jgi:ATP-dependent exoDNAse (exonuclease V) beta subunit
VRLLLVLGVPPTLAADDARLVAAFRQRFERLAEASARLSLERLCEQILVEHDYDLAVLAQWDGRRRYANLRKLARLARSYEELRGPDVEGFVRFVREQEAAGSAEREAVAEEEGAGAVRLLTIHAAKGLEFKVVVVADAGRDKAPPAPDEILCLADGRFGFRVAHPVSGDRRGAFGYDEVRDARRAEEDAERLRLYYVAMTRAQERLIVSGAVDRAKEAEGRTPIGWVLGRLDLDGELSSADGTVEVEREGARLVLRVDHHAPDAAAVPDAGPEAAETGQLALFEQVEDAVLPPAPRLHELVTVPEPPLHRVRRLSYSALALFERCSYRYYAERVAGLRPGDGRPSGEPGDGGLLATELGDAAHRLLELVDLREPTPPDASVVRSWYPRVTDEELARIERHVAAYCSSELASRVAEMPGAVPERPFAFEHDGVLLHGRLDVLALDGTRGYVLDYKTNLLGDLSPEEVVEEEYRLQRLVYALVCLRAGAEEVEVVYSFLERPDEPVSTRFATGDLPELEAALSEAIARIDAGDFRPTPSDFACSGCPALDVVCAGPRLRGSPPRPPALTAAG